MNSTSKFEHFEKNMALIAYAFSKLEYTNYILT